MAVCGEEYCKDVGGVRLELDLGCGPDCAKDAMSTRARLWLRSGGRSLVDILPIRSRTERTGLLQAEIPLGNRFVDLQSGSREQRCEYIDSYPTRPRSKNYYS